MPFMVPPWVGFRREPNFQRPKRQPCQHPRSQPNLAGLSNGSLEERNTVYSSMSVVHCEADVVGSR